MSRRVTRSSKLLADAELNRETENEEVNEEGAVGGSVVLDQTVVSEESQNKDLNMKPVIDSLSEKFKAMADDIKSQQTDTIQLFAKHLDQKMAKHLTLITDSVEQKLQKRLKPIEDEIETMFVRQEKCADEREEIFKIIVEHSDRCKERVEDAVKVMVNQVKEIDDDVAALIRANGRNQNDNRVCREVLNEVVDKVNETIHLVTQRDEHRENPAVVIKAQKPYLREFKENDPNPMQFINDVNKLVDKRPDMKDWYNLFPLVDKALKSVDYWWVVVKDNVDSVDDFAKKFKIKFWNKNIQREFITKLRAEKYSRNMGSMSQYFLKNMAILRNLDKPFSDEEIVQIIIEQMPEDVSRAILLQRLTDIDEIVQTLQSLDNLKTTDEGKGAIKKTVKINEGMPVAGGRDQGQRPYYSQGYQYQNNNMNRGFSNNNYQGNRGGNREFPGSNRTFDNRNQGNPRAQNQGNFTPGNASNPMRYGNQNQNRPNQYNQETGRQNAPVMGRNQGGSNHPN